MGFRWKHALAVPALKGKAGHSIGILFLTFVAALVSLVAASEPISVKVVGVSDGDTITVLDANNTQGKIRLHGIDCPEGGQAFGAKAKEFTSESAFGKTVSVDILETDRYGRFVATVKLPDGKSINDELVKAGLAWWYQQYAPDDAILKASEAEAKASNRGLWSDTSPIAPWEFRKGESEAKLGTLPKTSTPAPTIVEKAPQAETKSAEVYVTKTGAKYHRSGCRYLSRSMIPIDLDSAKQGYGACSVCSPPR